MPAEELAALLGAAEGLAAAVIPGSSAFDQVDRRVRWSIPISYCRGISGAIQHLAGMGSSSSFGREQGWRCSILQSRLRHCRRSLQFIPALTEEVRQYKATCS